MKTINRIGISAFALGLSVLSVPITPVITYATPGKNNASAIHSNAQNNSNSNNNSNDNRAELPVQSQAPADQEQSARDSSDTQAPIQPEQAQAAQSNSRSETTQAAQKSDPAGNNGTVKIDRTPFDNHPDNQPHVTCTFQVDFYGFDANVGDAKVQFDLKSPTRDGRTLAVTSGDLTPNIGQDAAGGGTDLDASETYTLAFTGAPHAKQGYHVKLTVNAPGSQGNDTKHKVFWVEACETPVTSTNPATPGTTTTPGKILGESASTKRAQILGSATSTPAVIPSTGGLSSMLLIAGLLAAAAAYGGAYSLQSIRAKRSL